MRIPALLSALAFAAATPLAAQAAAHPRATRSAAPTPPPSPTGSPAATPAPGAPRPPPRCRASCPRVRAEAGYVQIRRPARRLRLHPRSSAASPLASFDPGQPQLPRSVDQLERRTRRRGAPHQRGRLVRPCRRLERRRRRRPRAPAGPARSTRVEVSPRLLRRHPRRGAGAHPRVAAAGAARPTCARPNRWSTNGMATRSDALLASVQAGQVEAQLIGARGEAGIAHQRLALLLGQPGDTAFMLPDSLPSAGPDPRRSSATSPPDSAEHPARRDRRRLGVEAAQRDVRRANASTSRASTASAATTGTVPTSRSAARAATPSASWRPGRHSPARPKSPIARRREAAPRPRAPCAEAAEAGGRRSNSSATRTQHDVALARSDIAEVAVTQGAEAHRIVARKYAGGLATVAELL